jgi:hypothetical protein
VERAVIVIVIGHGEISKGLDGIKDGPGPAYSGYSFLFLLWGRLNAVVAGIGRQWPDVFNIYLANLLVTG